MFGDVRILEGDGKLTARINEVVEWPTVATDEVLQWTRDGEPIDGANSLQYTLTDVDKGCVVGLSYSFRVNGVKYRKVAVDPVAVPDPDVDRVSNAIAAIYTLVMDRDEDEAGAAFYTGHYNNGVALSVLVADMERNKAKGAT